MPHPQQLFFVGGVKQFLGEFFQRTKVLEIGSLDIEGSVRRFFEDCEYIGLDVGAGQGVDLVCRGEDYGGRANEFDVVISCEAMEHDPGWRKTWLNMLRLSKESGLVLMTCASAGRRRGATAFAPTDAPIDMQKKPSYYQNLVEDDFKAIVPCDAWFSVWSFYRDPASHGLHFFGLGKEASAEMVQRANELRTAFADYHHKRNVLGLQ